MIISCFQDLKGDLFSKKTKIIDLFSKNHTFSQANTFWTPWISNVFFFKKRTKNLKYTKRPWREEGKRKGKDLRLRISGNLKVQNTHFGHNLGNQKIDKCEKWWNGSTKWMPKKTHYARKTNNPRFRAPIWPFRVRVKVNKCHFCQRSKNQKSRSAKSNGRGVQNGNHEKSHTTINA